MITRGFIEKVHDVFDELNYHEKTQLDFKAFEQAAVKTLTHCKELSDAIDVVNMYQFCLKEWDKIEKMFYHKLQTFNEYEYEGNSLVSVVPDDEAIGTYYVTNGINKKIKDVFVASHSFDDEMFALGFENGKITVFEDGNYYMKYSKMSSVKMKLFNHKKDCLCNIVLSKDLGVFLEKNSTPYSLVVYNGFVGVYDREYIESLSNSDIIDTEKMIADIEWDILEENSKLGIAKLNVYVPDQDLEMLLFFATSTFLVFQKYIQSQDTKNFWASRRAAMLRRR